MSRAIHNSNPGMILIAINIIWMGDYDAYEYADRLLAEHSEIGELGLAITVFLCILTGSRLLAGREAEANPPSDTPIGYS